MNKTIIDLTSKKYLFTLILQERTRLFIDSRYSSTGVISKQCRPFIQVHIYGGSNSVTKPRRSTVSIIRRVFATLERYQCLQYFLLVLSLLVALATLAALTLTGDRRQIVGANDKHILTSTNVYNRCD